MRSLSRILILDDLFGRVPPEGRNSDRENLCAHFLWRDVSGDAAARASRQKVHQPAAEAVFFRGQFPTDAGLGCVVENDLEACLAMVRKGWAEPSAAPVENPHPRWALVLVDMCFYTGVVTVESQRRAPGMPEGRPEDDDPKRYFGLVLLAEIHRRFPDLPVVVFSSKPRHEVSLEFSRHGAVGFVARDDPQAPALFRAAFAEHGLLPDSSGQIVGSSLPLLLALREARRTANHRQNVLLRGERGTGKEAVAEYIHRQSTQRSSGTKSRVPPFVPVNSAAFASGLFTSELFGIEAKTATGVEERAGLIEMADGGDLFLDEIADMPAEIQAAMLRVLQERQMVRVGARKPIPVDVRFLSATNIDVDHLGSGFRPDLLDRLRQGGTISLPPLRERTEDLPALARHFAAEAEKLCVGSRPRDIAPETFAVLASHAWPGNVRELRAVLFDAVSRFPDVEFLVPRHLRLAEQPAPYASRRNEPVAAIVPAGEFDALVEHLDRFVFPVQTSEVWAGKFDQLSQATARLAARYLEACLHATKRRTPLSPQGEIRIHPAVRLMTGNGSLTASQAADIIKRVLGPLAETLSGDLRIAYGIAIRLRPKSSRNSATA